MLKHLKVYLCNNCMDLLKMYLCNSCMVVCVGLLKMYLCLYLLDYLKCICAKGLGRGLPLPRCELLRLCSSASAAGLASRAGVRCNCAALKPGIYGLAFSMGKCFLTDNWATVGRILIISSAHPHRILILIKW